MLGPPLESVVPRIVIVSLYHHDKQLGERGSGGRSETKVS